MRRYPGSEIIGKGIGGEHGAVRVMGVAKLPISVVRGLSKNRTAKRIAGQIDAQQALLQFENQVRAIQLISYLRGNFREASIARTKSGLDCSGSSTSEALNRLLRMICI